MPWSRAPPLIKEMKPHDSLDVSDHLPAGSFCHPAAVRVSGGYARPGWYPQKKKTPLVWLHANKGSCPHPHPGKRPRPRPRPNSLLASSVSFAARQRHLDHTGSESDPQGVTLAVYLHADNALVVDGVDAAPGEGRQTRVHLAGPREEQMLVLRGGGIRMWQVSRREINPDSGTRGG